MESYEMDILGAGELYKDLLVTCIYLFFGMYLVHKDVVQRLHAKMREVRRL